MSHQTEKQTLTIYGGMNGVKSGDIFICIQDTVEGRQVLKLEKLPEQEYPKVQGSKPHWAEQQYDTDFDQSYMQEMPA